MRIQLGKRTIGRKTGERSKELPPGMLSEQVVNIQQGRPSNIDSARVFAKAAGWVSGSTWGGDTLEANEWQETKGLFISAIAVDIRNPGQSTLQNITAKWTRVDQFGSIAETVSFPIDDLETGTNINFQKTYIVGKTLLFLTSDRGAYFDIDLPGSYVWELSGSYPDRRFNLDLQATYYPE